jgi:hypothetical protein
MSDQTQSPQKTSGGGGHDPETGALHREMAEIPNSASNWKSYLKSKEHHTHPYRYPAGITNIVGSLGAGKSTLVYNLLQELSEIIKPEKLGRVIYYSGSGSDKLLEAYDKDRVELFDKRSKESFLTALKELQNDAMTTPSEKKKMNILVVDDGIVDPDIMPTNIKSKTELSNLMMSARHVPVSIFLTSQKYSAIPPFARLNSSNLFAFRTKSPGETKAILNEANFVKKEVEDAFNSLTDSGEFLWFQNLDRNIIKGLNVPLCY